MPNKSSAWKEPYRLAIEESKRFLGREGEFERESWVVARLLQAIGVPFQQHQFEDADEPVDVAFVDARFQIKELMESDRRRGDELKENLRKLKDAASEVDLLERYTPKDISFSDVVAKTLSKAEKLEEVGYGPSERHFLDLLCYFNYLDYSVIPPFDFDTVRSSFRSISIVSNTYCGVIFVSEQAPNFLRSKLGRFEMITE